MTLRDTTGDPPMSSIPARRAPEAPFRTVLSNISETAYLDWMQRAAQPSMVLFRTT
jgi:hypothetical protein